MYVHVHMYIDIYIYIHTNPAQATIFPYNCGPSQLWPWDEMTPASSW